MLGKNDKSLTEIKSMTLDRTPGKDVSEKWVCLLQYHEIDWEKLNLNSEEVVLRISVISNHRAGSDCKIAKLRMVMGRNREERKAMVKKLR